MSLWMSIGLDLAVLAFFGFLYYIFQRKRIIKKDLSEVYSELEKIIFEIHEYLDTNKNEDLNSYAELIESEFKNDNRVKLLELLKNIPTSATDEMREDLQAMESKLSENLQL